MITDLITILYWWLLIFSIGIVFLPVGFSIFKNFPDKGYGLSKSLGIILVSWLSWWLGSLRLVSFSIWGLYLVLVSFWLLNLFLLRQQRKKWLQQAKKLWRLWLIEELVFFISLISFSFIRAHQPDIIGLEKYMDFGFVNSILRSQYFPPKDIWWQGGIINYYYFGHLITAVLTKLSGLASNITYNLMIATLFGLTLSSAFSLAGNLWLLNKRKLKLKSFMAGGLIAGLAITLMSNLHPLIYIWQGINKYWYPDATRFIPNTIHEFPIYTFTVADLHGHLNNLPNVILLMALLIAIWQNLKQQKELINKRLIILLAVFSIFLGVAYMTSAWDFILYLVTAGFVWLFMLWQKKGLLKALGITFLMVLTAGLWSGLFSFPFHLHFKNFAQGIGLVKERSELWRLLILWGFWAFVSLTFFVGLTLKKSWKKLKPKELLVLGFLGSAWFLVVVPEFIYLKDIYSGHYRANTMFKMVFAAWVLFGFSGSLIAQWVKENFKKLSKTVWLTIFLLTMTGCLTYPVWAIRSYYNGLKHYRGLNGTAYLNHQYPNDWAGIQWLKTNVKNQPVVLEAVGESYTEYARVSVHTGLPTVVGWRVHEWLWRGSFDPVGKRSEDVKKIYEGENEKEIRSLINKYQVRYIFIGTLEKKSYPNLKENIINRLGKKVFEKNQVKIYKLEE